MVTAKARICARVTCTGTIVPCGVLTTGVGPDGPFPLPQGTFGGGFGPLATGAISDSLTASYGPQGLRYSLMLMMSLLVMTGGFFYLFGREMPTDLED